jgi:hypothetical protein
MGVAVRARVFVGRAVSVGLGVTDFVGASVSVGVGGAGVSVGGVGVLVAATVRVGLAIPVSWTIADAVGVAFNVGDERMIQPRIAQAMQATVAKAPVMRARVRLCTLPPISDCVPFSCSQARDTVRNWGECSGSLPASGN